MDYGCAGYVCCDGDDQDLDFDYGCAGDVCCDDDDEDWDFYSRLGSDSYCSFGVDGLGGYDIFSTFRENGYRRWEIENDFCATEVGTSLDNLPLIHYHSSYCSFDDFYAASLLSFHASSYVVPPDHAFSFSSCVPYY